MVVLHMASVPTRQRACSPGHLPQNPWEVNDLTYSYEKQIYKKEMSSDPGSQNFSRTAKQWKSGRMALPLWPNR